MAVVMAVLAQNIAADTATSEVTVGNSAPVASTVAIADGNLVGGEISLSANVTTQVNVSATITDNNGCTDIDAVNATLFRTNITNGSIASNDNSSHYSAVCTVQSGTCTGDSDLTADYDCFMQMEWYADATDAGSQYAPTNWTVNVSPYDDDGIGTSDSTVYDLATVTAFTLLQTNISFGVLALGQNTTTNNQNISVQNIGNERIDINLTGYGTNSGDNISMNCTLGTIPIHNLEYDNASFTYGAGVDLSNSSTELEFDLNQGNESTKRPDNPVFFGFEIPSDGVGGSCNGNVVIVAVSDPGAD